MTPPAMPIAGGAHRQYIRSKDMSAAHKVELSQFLKHQHLCESLTMQEINTLLEYVTHAHFSKNEVIADIGTLGEALYFVVKGEVALIYEAPTGDQQEVGRMVEGEVMGEMSFFDRRPRSARLVAKSEDTQVLVLTRARYKRLRVEHPYIAVNLLEHVIISLDHLFRRVSQDYTEFSSYLYGRGK